MSVPVTIQYGTAPTIDQYHRIGKYCYGHINEGFNFGYKGIKDPATLIIDSVWKISPDVYSWWFLTAAGYVINAS